MSLGSGGNSFIRATSWRLSTIPCCVISAYRARSWDFTYQSTSGRIDGPEQERSLGLVIRAGPHCETFRVIKVRFPIVWTQVLALGPMVGEICGGSQDEDSCEHLAGP